MFLAILDNEPPDAPVFAKRDVANSCDVSLGFLKVAPGNPV
jgi:hypothetical protein